MKILEEIKKKPYYIEDLSKTLHRSYSHTYDEVRGLKKKELLDEEEDIHDKRKKILTLTEQGKIFLEKTKARKSAIAKLDFRLDKKFSEIGINCERLFDGE